MIVFDFETTNKDFGSALNPENKLVMVSWTTDGGRTVYNSYTPMMCDEFWNALNSEKVAACHNAKFEMLWLQRLGYDIHRLAWHDTMLAERVLNGNVRRKLGLGALCNEYGLPSKDRLIDSLMRGGVCPSEMPRARLAGRCNRDVRSTAIILKQQLGELERTGKHAVYRQRCEFTPVLAEMEFNGMDLDATDVTEEYEKACQKKAALEFQLDALTGGINLRSSDQLAHFLYEKLHFPERKDARGKVRRNKPSKQWPDGKPLTDKATLTYLADKASTPEQKMFVSLRQEYGKVNAALSKTLEFFKGVCDEREAHFHGQFNQTVASTHRLTSSGLPQEFLAFGKRSTQFQNMPREFKKLFKAPNDDYYVVEVDHAQLEFRVAVFLGDDEQGRKDISDPDFDAHLTSAAVMSDMPYDKMLDLYRKGDKVVKSMRQRAKAETFKPLYGGTKGTPEQERWYAEFRRRYPGINSAQQNWLSEVERTGSLQLPWGMEFSWNVEMNKRGVLMDMDTMRPVGPQVFNYPVQNLATAEITPFAITSLVRRCKEAGLRAVFVNTVHDSVIAYVHKDDLTDYIDSAKMAFTVDVYAKLRTQYGIKFDVPLGCEITYGDRWGQGESIVHDNAK